MAVYQCTRCGFWSRSRDAVIEHLSNAHRHESPISIDDFAVRPEPSHRLATRELRFSVPCGRRTPEFSGY